MDGTNKLYDVTNLTPAALEVFIEVKLGNDVVVEHLTLAERISVCEVLGVPLTPGHPWLASDNFKPRTNNLPR